MADTFSTTWHPVLPFLPQWALQLFFSLPWFFSCPGSKPGLVHTLSLGATLPPPTHFHACPTASSLGGGGKIPVLSPPEL